MRTLALALLAGCSTGALQAPTPAWVDDTSSYGGPNAATAISERYRDVAAKIIASARADRGAYKKLAYLTDQIGSRLAGSTQLDKAIAWAAQAMKDDGLEVRTEKVMVPHWIRGVEEAAITSPVDRRLHLLTLGGSVATPKGGLLAPIVVVHDWKELETKADQIKGAIVVYNVAMPAWTADKGSGYGTVVPYRFAGATQAAKRGAVAALIRSVTARSLSTPHTGAMGYDKDTPKIPAASISVEDAELLDRLSATNKVTIRLRLEPQLLPDVESRQRNR